MEILDAASLLQRATPVWTAERHTELLDWFAQFYNWYKTSLVGFGARASRMCPRHEWVVLSLCLPCVHVSSGLLRVDRSYRALASARHLGCANRMYTFSSPDSRRTGYLEGFRRDSSTLLFSFPLSRHLRSQQHCPLVRSFPARRRHAPRLRAGGRPPHRELGAECHCGAGLS